jgi:hypothetical protein
MPPGPPRASSLAAQLLRGWVEVTNMNCANKDCRCQETVVEEAGRQFCSERCAQANISAEGT